MAVYANTNMELLVDGFAIEGFANSATMDVQVDELDVTTLGSAGWRQKITGLATHTIAVSGFQDYALTGVDPTLTGTGTGQNVVTFCPINGGAAVTDPAFFGAGRTTTRTPISGAVGDAAAFTFDWAGNGRLVRGQVLHPIAARTVTGSGTAATFTTPVAGQGIWASFHVTSVTGTGTITFTIQTDDNSGFSSSTTRLTATAMAAVGGQFATSATGALAGETHIRVGYAISGFTSVTFFAAAGVA